MVWRLFVVVAVLVSGCGSVRPPPSPPRTTSMGIKLSTLELTNGLRVVLVRDPMAADVQVTTRYRVGAVNDPPGQAGMAHLVEHLMFEQTLGDQSLSAHLEAIASGHNAFTTLDATTFVERAQPDKLDKLLSIEAVRMGFGCTSIPDSAFDREREVVVQEAKLYGTYDELMQAVGEALYPESHPYRKYPRGTVNTLAAITREQACAFVKAHYAPNNAVMVISSALEPEVLTASLQRFVAKLPRREVAAPIELPVWSPRRLDAPGPLDRDVLLVSWPLPLDPEARAQIDALAPALVGMIDGSVRGSVFPFPVGDGRAPSLMLVIVPAEDETVASVVAAVRQATETLPGSLEATVSPFVDAFQLDTIRQTAIYRLMSSLEDGSHRDTELAADALAGRDPNETLTAAAQGLRALAPDTAAEIARARLSFAKASVITLKARSGPKRGQSFPDRPVAHDAGRRRAVVSADAAHAPAAIPPLPKLDHSRSYVLPNGMRIVLLPMTSVPAIDIRLIFAAGTGDDGAKLGTALAAAHGLNWHPRYLNDAIRFIAAGGTDRVEVGLDHTVFVARGVDMHLDVLLAGLRRRVRDGIYDFSREALARAVRALRKQTDENDLVDDAVRAALFGDDHPYTRAGTMRHINETLTPADAQAFRDAYFTPSNATLVIAGRFDIALAAKWVEYLFGTWAGAAKARVDRAPTPHPETLVNVADVTGVRLRLAMPARGGTRAQRLVAAAMLDEIVSDVRHQLAASYAFSASLLESRLASAYEIDGWIDAPRLAEASKLLVDRLAQLRSDPAVTSIAFVNARQRVLTRLAAAPRSSAALADLVESEVARAEPMLSEERTIEAVRTLTIDQMGAALAELDLPSAVIAIRGPETESQRALATFGRTATPVSVDRAALAALDRAPLPDDSAPGLDGYDLAPPITQQPGPANVLASFTVGYMTAHVGRDYDSTLMAGEPGTAGLSLAGKLAYRMTRRSRIGFHGGLGILAGNYKILDNPVREGARHVAVDTLGVIQIEPIDRAWIGVLGGVHWDRTNEFTVPTWTASISMGAEIGVDVLRADENRLALTGNVVWTLLSDNGYYGFVLGLAYRRL